MEGKLFWLVALTAVHPGVGRSEEAQVDLPVQRDEFGLPTVWASSLKGAIRAKAELGLFRDGLCVREAGAVCRGSCGLWPQARGGV
jgi:CRISPR-associated protein Cmr4